MPTRFGTVFEAPFFPSFFAQELDSAASGNAGIIQEFRGDKVVTVGPWSRSGELKSQVPWQRDFC